MVAPSSYKFPEDMKTEKEVHTENTSIVHSFYI